VCMSVCVCVCVFFQDIIGYNLAGLRHLKQLMEEKEDVKFFADATDRYREKKRKIKKKAILAIKV